MKHNKEYYVYEAIGNITFQHWFDFGENTLLVFNFFPTGPADYEGGTKIAIFEVGSSTATVTFGTEDDEVKEGMESFRATLSVSEAMREKGVSVGSPDTAVVNIIDNDGKSCCNYECMYSATLAGHMYDCTCTRGTGCTFIIISYRIIMIFL